MRWWCAVMFAVLFPAIATAQNSGIYVLAGPLLDIRITSSTDSFPIDARSVVGSSGTFTWNDINGDRIRQPGEEGVPVFGGFPSIESRRSQERFAPGVSVALGVFVTPSVSLRVEGSFQGAHVTTTEADQLTLAIPAVSRHTASSTDVLVSAGWHQGGSRKVTITYLAGMVFRRQRDESTLTFNYASLIPTIIGRPTPPGIPQTFEASFGSTMYSAGVMAGLDVGFNLSQHVALVPQLRMVAANHEWGVRPALAVRWRP